MASLSHFLFITLILYLWKSNSKTKVYFANIIVYLACTFGLYWIFISLNYYGNLSPILSIISTLILALYVSIFYLIAGFLVRKFSLKPIEVAALICILEWVRSQLFGGFPWLDIGIIQIDSPISSFASIFGVYGVTFLTVLFVELLLKFKWQSTIKASSIILFGVFLQSFNFVEPKGEKLNVALLQGSIPQQLKFDPTYEKKYQKKYLGMITKTLEENKNLDLIVLPETALAKPWNYLNSDFRFTLLDKIKKFKGILITGIPIKTFSEWKNSVIAINGSNLANEKIFFSQYDKHHLVPFGEFIPHGFKWFVNLINIPFGEFTKGSLPQNPIPVKDQFIGVNICFEDLFADEIIQSFSFTRKLEQVPSILLNVSNLGWFGKTNALNYQLKASRMRSIETGRPMIRSTNTGFTAHINHNGEIKKILPSMETHYLYAEVQGMKGKTPFSYVGNKLILIFCLLIFIMRLYRFKF